MNKIYDFLPTEREARLNDIGVSQISTVVFTGGKMPGDRQLQFASSYEALAERSGVDIDSRIDDSLRSYMDRGDAAFAGEIVDSDSGKTRENVIAAVRNNIKRQMKQENTASGDSAAKQKDRHREYSNDIAADVTKLRAKKTEINENQAKYERLLAEGAGRGGAAKFFTGYAGRKKYRESHGRTLLNEYAVMGDRIRSKAEAWQQIEEDYVKNVFRKHYDNYDALAKTWYELTREYTRPSQVNPVQPNPVQPNPVQPNPAQPNPVQNPAAQDGAQPNQVPGAGAQPAAAQVDERAIPEDASKKIVEYTGVYDEGGIQAVLELVSLDPSTPVAGDNLVIKDYKQTKAGSANEADPRAHTKTHKKIVMLSQEDETTGLKTRFKFGRDLRGKLASKQFTPQSRDIPTAVAPPANGNPDILAEDANLESDERDINGRFLVSERNAEIISAKVKRTGQRVHGFYLNGQFVTDERTAPGQKVSGREDMSWLGRRNWDKQEKADKLRAAIRKSAFFQHVNARTIQFYASYQADEDYTNDIGEAIGKGMNDAASGDNPMSAWGAVQRLMTSPNLMDGIPKGLLGQALALYASDRAAGGQGGAPVQGFDITEPHRDPVISYAFEKHGSDMSVAALILLTNDTNPRLWTLAKHIVLKNPATAPRTRSKLGYLPKAGEAMRMALMEELANHQQRGSEFDSGNVLGILNLPGQRVYTEELENRRGVGNWFKRNLLNGNILKNVITAAEVGVNTGANISDAISLGIAESKVSEAKNDGDKEKAKEELEHVKSAIDAKADDRMERHFWFSYAQTCTDFSQMSTFVNIAAMGATAGASAYFGGDVTGNMTIARDVTFDVLNIADMVSSVIKMINMARQLVKYLYRKFRSKTADEVQREREEAHRTLTDRDGSALQAVLKFIDSALAFCAGARDIASVHVTPKGGGMSVGNDLWGGLVKTMGPIDMIITNLRRMVKIVDDIREIVASTRRIGRIDTADADIETAISSIRNMSPQEIEAAKISFENDTGNLFATDEEREAGRKASLGEAARNNSQAQYFMSLTKAQSRKSRSNAGWNIASNVLGGLKDLATLIPKSMGGSIIKAVAGVLPKATEFIGWAVGKLKYDRGNFNDNIAMMLGDRSYAKMPYFNEVLKRETGIVNKHYLVDLARIFTSIDTHAMLKNPNATVGEMELAKSVVGTLYGNVNDESVRTIKLKSMLSYAGMSGGSDWRALLRNSLRA